MIVRVAMVDLPRDPSAASEARGRVAGFPCELSPGQRTDAIQGVNELVTDAYMHGEGRIRLRLESTGHGLRAEVESLDGTARRNGQDNIRMGVVRTVSEACGIDADSAMTWFEIGTNGRAPAIQAKLAERG
jgi:hypothetical protein